MLGQPSKSIALDFWTLIPEILANNKPGILGRFELRDGTIHPVPAVTKARFSEGRYFIGLALPSSAEDLATGLLKLTHPEWPLPRIVLLVGNPTGSGNFKWRGVCPHTFEPTQMLFFDWGTQLFVSRQANKRNAPLSVKLVAVDQILAQELAENDEISLAKTATQSSAALKFNEVLKVCMMENGYPVTIRNEHTGIDVLATVRCSRDRQRLPVALLRRLREGRAVRNNETIFRVSNDFETANRADEVNQAEAPSVSSASENLTKDLDS